MERDRRLATLFRTDRKAWAVQMNKHTRLLLPWSIVDDVVEYCLRELNPLMNMFNRVILRTELRELRGNLCGHVHGYGSSSTSGGILGSLDSAIVSDDTYDRNQVDRGPETFAQCGAHSSRGAEARSSFARGGASARRYAPVSNDLGNARQSTRFLRRARRPGPAEQRARLLPGAAGPCSADPRLGPSEFAGARPLAHRALPRRTACLWIVDSTVCSNGWIW